MYYVYIYIYMSTHILFLPCDSWWSIPLRVSAFTRWHNGCHGSRVGEWHLGWEWLEWLDRDIIIDPNFFGGLQKWEIYSGLMDILWYFMIFWCILIAKNDDSPMDWSFQMFPTCADTAFWPMLAHTPDLWPQRIQNMAEMLFFHLPLMFNLYFFSDQTVSDWSICSEANHINHWSDQSPWPSG